MVEKFKFWCQKVLPTIYDDSLSYYEAICKMATYLNATIDQVNEFQKMIDALPETILNSEEFQKMVQDAVDGKIDALYKVVQDALDAFEARQASFEKLMSNQFENFETQVNIDNNKFKGEVNSKLTGYETSDAQFKQEVNTKLSGYESDNAQFKSQVNAKVDEIPTKIAEYPKYPMCQNSNGAVTQEFDVAMTYYHNDNLIYGNYHTPFNTNAAAQSGKYEIDCSSFVQLCLMGVPYENTRWFNDKNVPVSGYYFGEDLIIDPDADRPYGMLSDDMCNWFVEHGYYFETRDPNQLKPGDVVFYTFNTESPTYKHVTHCGLFVSYQEIGDEYWCISASNPTDGRPKVVSREAYPRMSTSIVGFGRLPLPDCAFELNDLTKNGFSQDLVGTKSINLTTIKYQDIGRIRLIKNLEPNKMYTLALRVTDANLPLFFNIMSGNNNMTNISFSSGEWIYMPFCINFLSTPEVTGIPFDTTKNQYIISVIARRRDDEVERSCNFKELALYEGVVVTPIKNTDAINRDYLAENTAYTFDPRDTLAITTDDDEAREDPTTLLGFAASITKNLPTGIFKRATAYTRRASDATSILDAGYYWFDTVVVLKGDGTIGRGGQYFYNFTTGSVYFSTCANSKWTAPIKIGPYTPAP